MISKLSLANWKCHLNSNLEFSDGTNCFIGKIGSGKTSILDAICFALFGTFPQLQQKKIKLEDVVMKKPEKKKKAEIELTFEINEDEYTVKRIIDVNRSKAELKKDGQVVEVQPKKVTEEIENILKIDYDLFTRAIYSEQNQLDMFLTVPKGQRMKKIDDLLKLEKFEKARTTAISLINRFKISQKEKQGLIENMEKDEIIKNIDDIKKELEKVLKEKIELGDKINSVKKDKEKIKEKLEELKEIQKKLQNISEEKTILSSINKQLESDLSELKDIQLDVKEDLLEKLSSEINDLEEKLDKEKIELETKKQESADNKARKEILEEKIQEIKEKLEERKKIEKMLKKKDEIEKRFEDMNKNLEENQHHFRLSNLKASQLKTSIKQLETVDKSCPTCFQKLSQEKRDKLIEKNKTEIKELEKQSKQYEKELKKLSDEKNELEEKVNEIRLYETKLETLPEKQEKQNLEKELKTLKEKIDEKELNKLEKDIDSYYKKLDELKSEKDKIKNILEKKSELEKKQETFDSNKKEIEDLEKNELKLKKDFSEEKLNNLEKGFEDIIGIEKQIEAKLENIDLIKNEKEKRLEEVENKKNLLEEYKNKLEKEKILKEQLELLEKMLVLTQEQLRKNFVVAINQAMHSIWNELYPYGDFSSIRLAIDGDYTLQLQDNNGWVSVDVVSGGERSIACLVLRIAFALILAPQLRWLVLDEPTHNLDSKAINELANVLREKITEFVDQIFLITHDPALEEAVSGFLYRIEREKERNGFAKVFKIGLEN